MQLMKSNLSIFIGHPCMKSYSGDVGEWNGFCGSVTLSFIDKRDMLRCDVSCEWTKYN